MYEVNRKLTKDLKAAIKQISIKRSKKQQKYDAKVQTATTHAQIKLGALHEQ